MDPWYKVVTPRKEVREGRSFNPDEFAIAMEQVVAGTAPDDYNDPKQFFSRNYFTQALIEHSGMVLRRLSGDTKNTAPVLTLVTQFGGGKTHTLTALYHLANSGDVSKKFDGIPELLKEAGLKTVPKAKVGVFVGSAWDPQKGAETPWIDLARQLAGEKGVELLGPNKLESPPGTKAITDIVEAAGSTVLILFDEVLNFVNRYKKMAGQFHAFIQNLTVAIKGTTNCAAIISLPRSQVEMTDWDMEWQQKITKVVKRVAKGLFVADEEEVSEVIRRRLFEDIGSEDHRKKVAKAYANWCFERRASLPPEWTAVDTATSDAKSKEYLQQRFEACYPFHPATLSVFQRKWQALTQYQQTRGTLAMLAQWISLAYQEGFKSARKEPLITLGSAPLHERHFVGITLDSIGESRLATAIETDIASSHSHAKALDADTKNNLLDIHRRVGSTIFFESSGGQTDKIATLPQLRYALGEPKMDTTSIDNASHALEARAFFISKVGTDGYRVYHKATIRKAVADKKASLDEETDIKPVMLDMIKKEFNKGKKVQLSFFPENGEAIPDSPRLILAIMDPSFEWTKSKDLRQTLIDWTFKRGSSTRLYPAALVWCFKKPGKELRDKVENWLAWQRVQYDIRQGILGPDYDKADKAEITARVKEAENAAVDEVWAEYRYVILSDPTTSDKLLETAIDLGAGHSSAGESLTGRIITSLKSSGLLNETVGAGYIDRKWPEALKESGAWPLSGLRQSFLNGTLTRLTDPDRVLKSRIPDFVFKGEFGLASGLQKDGSYQRIYFNEMISADDVEFDPDVFLMTAEKANQLTSEPVPIPEPEPGGPTPTPDTVGEEGEITKPEPVPEGKVTFTISGKIPWETWNRLGRNLIPKLRTGEDLKVGVDFSVTIGSNQSKKLLNDIQQSLDDLGLSGQVKIKKEG